jgi:hypothetical protein
MAMNQPLATAPVIINFPLNQSGKQIGDVLNAHASRLDTDEANIAANTTQGNNNASAISSLQADNTTNKNNIASLQSQVNSLSQRVTNLESATGVTTAPSRDDIQDNRINQLITRVKKLESIVLTTPQQFSNKPLKRIN